MGTYKLVRESREGRQTKSDRVHCIRVGKDETYCSSLNKKEVKSVRTLSVFTGDSELCQECSDIVDLNKN